MYVELRLIFGVRYGGHESRKKHERLKIKSQSLKKEVDSNKRWDRKTANERKNTAEPNLFSVHVKYVVSKCAMMHENIKATKEKYTKTKKLKKKKKR